MSKAPTPRVLCITFFMAAAMIFSAGSGLKGTAWAGSESEMLRQQMEVMKKQMGQLQKAMEVMQNRIEELETQPSREAKAPSEAEKPSVWTKYNMKLYGKVKMEVNYDTGELTNADSAFMVKAGSDTSNSSANFNPRDTRFGFEASKAFNDDWMGKGRFEVDFYGQNNGGNLIPRMRLGYVDIVSPGGTSFLAGQDWVPVAQLNPAIMDFAIAGSAGNLWQRRPQLTVRHTSGNFEFLGSAMKPNRLNTNEEDRMPWLLARIAYQNGKLPKGSYLALGGGYRHAKYGQSSTAADTRWLVAAEAKFKVQSFQVQGELWSGKGIDSNFLRSSLDTTLTGEAAAAYGGWMDVTYFITPEVSLTAGYGLDNPDDDDIGSVAAYTGDQNLRFTRNEQYYLNSWYSMTENLKLGLEFIHVATERNATVNDANRYTFATQFMF
jgi:hypothetical protein